MAVTNQKGEVLFLWKEGGQVNWALYRTDGKLAHKPEKAGALPGKDKPTAFVGSDGHFYLVF
jgi:hypothetical protein